MSATIASHMAVYETIAILRGAAGYPHEAEPPTVDHRVPKATAFIRANLAGELDRSSLASLAGLSPTRFHYEYRAATGPAPIEYVNNERLRAARHLLLSTTLTARRIAFRCGFATAQYFSLAFRRTAGYTSQDFRRTFAAGRPPNMAGFRRTMP